MRHSVALLVLSFAAPLAWSQQPAPAACAAAKQLAVADLRVTAADWKTADAKSKGHCRVQGIIEKEIGFELWLPAREDWNGRFLGAGVGGQAGAVNSRELQRGAARGYATASTDSGHKASDKHWLLGDPQRAENYAGRANHLLAVKARELTTKFYDTAPNKAFFVGCSGGGRQALTELQRYPTDYDGIIAGAPGVNTPEMSARRMWEMIQHSASAAVLSEDDWKWVAHSAVQSCDADDGIKDNIIGNPARCGFKPASLQCKAGATGRCLSAQQLEVVQRIYAPLKDENGRKIDDGLSPGVIVTPVPAPEPFTPGPAYLAVVLFGDGVHKDANWKPSSFRMADDLPAIDKVMNLHADNPDVAAFKARGGKLILYHGWADPLVATQPTIDYYLAMQKKLGGEAGVREFARLFLVPGMEHCIGGGVADRFGGAGGDAPQVDPEHDMLSALERWSAGGPAPERIIASKVEPADGRVLSTRPLCAYPREAKYRGNGSTELAGSFTCQ